MNAIIKVTGLIVLVAVAYSVVGGSAALAAPGPEREQPLEVLPVDPPVVGPSMDINIDPCLLIDCGDIVQQVPTATPTETEEPTATPTETEVLPTATPTETEVPPTATPTDEPPNRPTDEPTQEPTDEPQSGKLPGAGTGDGAGARSNQGTIALFALGLAGIVIALALVLTLRRKGARQQ